MIKILEDKNSQDVQVTKNSKSVSAEVRIARGKYSSNYVKVNKSLSTGKISYSIFDFGPMGGSTIKRYTSKSQLLKDLSGERVVTYKDSSGDAFTILSSNFDETKHDYYGIDVEGLDKDYRSLIDKATEAVESYELDDTTSFEYNSPKDLLGQLLPGYDKDSVGGKDQEDEITYDLKSSELKTIKSNLKKLGFSEEPSVDYEEVYTDGSFEVLLWTEPRHFMIVISKSV